MNKLLRLFDYTHENIFMHYSLQFNCSTRLKIPLQLTWHNENDGNMYILPECIAGIKQKQLKNDAKKNT